MVSVTSWSRFGPGKAPTVPIVQEAEWALEPVWTQGLEEKSYCLCRGSNLDRLIVQPVARHCIELPGSHKDTSILYKYIMISCSVVSP
jgi:hypothetical protein